MRVALAQFDVVLGDVEANLGRVHEAAVEAAAAAVDLLVFPELFLSGYRLAGHPGAAVAVDDPRIMAALRVGDRHLSAVVTMQERDGDARYNTAACYRDGRVVHVQRKLALVDYAPFNEHEHFQAGTSIATFDAGGCTAAILICNDAWTPDRAVDVVTAGARLLIVPVNSAVSEYSKTVDTERAWREITEATATGLGCALVMVNRVGEEEGLRFFGSSRVVHPTRGVLGEGPRNAEAMLVHDLEVGVPDGQPV